MPKVNGKKYQPLRISSRRRRNGSRHDRLVITFAIPDGEVIDVESLDESGRRSPLQDRQLELLKGDDEIQDLGDAVEKAYAAGLADAEEIACDEPQHETAHFEEVARAVLGREVIRRGMGKLILRHLLRHELMDRREKVARQSRARSPTQTPSRRHKRKGVNDRPSNRLT